MTNAKSRSETRFDKAISLLLNNSWQGFVLRNQTLDEEILISGAELSEIEDEIREIRILLDDV